ncbi:COP1-interacting protein 7-like isoform X2 [Magnolia sinica]|uniref:COP1-interacting protein 7-like isoform X2 n=1 Tax=Magnolia sinica TaxID=86752 RepID=UPI002659EF80|nr:COP1-interacting protein 7-like isoform X2 [Magnolia sinica]
MKSETRLDSAVFQLTPTRTRCDLVITANGKMEKIASGLLNPFLAHLSTAQDQIAKGGYSIALEPGPGSDVSWFTKGAVERFVRFVSTPEVLERVNTIESEILQIDEAIASQSVDNPGLSTVEGHQARSTESIEGRKPIVDTNADKAIVLFKPGVQTAESNGSTTQEETSKVQLLRVLETRKTVLQKEQGMAFARAVAAGFDMDQMTQLISFAECFGATRLREACLRYMELWKQKHETGQWLEIEAAEAMSTQSDFSSMNAMGIVLSGDVMKQKEFREPWPESHVELGKETNEKSNDANADQRPPIHSQVPSGPHEYFQGNFQHPMYPQWPIHSPPGAPVFQQYPMQGVPYYQNYPGNAPFFQPPYPPMEDPRFNAAQRMGHKRHSMDSKDSNIESESSEMGTSTAKSQDGGDQNMSELEKEDLQIRIRRKKVGRSGKKQPGMVVIRNLNYITSKKHDSSGSESQSASEPETNEDDDDLQSDAPVRNHKNSVRSAKGKGSHSKFTNTRSSNDGDSAVYGQDANGENWQAFQNFLLRDDEEKTDFSDRGMFSAEKEVTVKRQQSRVVEDPILPPERNLTTVPNQRMSEFDIVSGQAVIYKQRASNDESAISHEGFHPSGGLRDSQLDVQFTETESGGGRYRRANDAFMIYEHGNKSGTTNYLPDPLAGNEFWPADNLDKRSNNVTDESFIVPFRSSSQDQVGTDSRAAIDMGSEFSSSLQRTEDSSNMIRSQLSYEPDDLSMMPERGVERESIGYDPAIDYEMQLCAEDAKVFENVNPEEATGGKEGLKKLDKEKKSRAQDALEKRKMEAAMRKVKPSKYSPLAEAKERAEKLRMFKADIQKMKKEQEEEEVKRLEALKRERQKRIAARGGSNPAQSPLPSQQTGTQLPTKRTTGSNKGPKSSDSSSPIQKLSTRTAVGSGGSQKTTRPSSRLNGVHPAGSGLTQSMSSLTELKHDNDSHMPKDSEPKAASIRTRRLSDPKGSSGHQVSLKSGGSDKVPKPKVSGEPESKKISSITSLDRTKSATLPEMKIRTPRSNLDQNNSTTRGTVQKSNVSGSSVTSESIKLKKSNEKTSHQLDDNSVIEKTVVMLEDEMPAIPIVQASEEKIEIERGSYGDDTEEKTEVVAEYAAIGAPPSPIVIGEVGQDPSKFQLDKQPKSNEVTLDYTGDEMPNASSIGVAETPYHAPYARNLSLEDPCTSNLECSKTTTINSEMATSTETVKLRISDFTDPNFQEEISKEVEKPRGKESSKGFRRLLKFGRKNHSSAVTEPNVDSDNLSIDSSAVDEHIATTASSSEVHMLKNLIPQDDVPIGGTAQKASRPFSLLSTFRSKTGEKKLMT